MLTTSSFLAYIVFVATSKQLAEIRLIFHKKEKKKKAIGSRDDRRRAWHAIFDDSSLVNNWTSLLLVIVTFQPNYLFLLYFLGKKKLN